MASPRRSGALTLGMLAVLVAGCAGPTSAPVRAPDAPAQSAPTAPKSLTIGITGSLPALALAATSTPVGGGFRLQEIHSDGLITSDVNVRRPIGRLAERAPSLDDGSISLLPDGRMRVTFALRKGVTWHDGTPFTAHDMLFSYHLAGPEGIANQFNDTLRLMSSIEAPDDHSLIVHYKAPHYLGAALGTPEFWPVPRHLLQPAYDRFVASKDPDEILQLRYWSSEYVHLGAFRLTRFDPGEGMTLEAYDRYYLGRPKIDTVRVRVFGDQPTLVTNLLAGAAELVPEFALRGEAGAQLKLQWEQSGQATVHVKGSSLYNMPVQYRPNRQSEPANLDPRVRRALLHALDRESISDAINGGNPQLAGWSFLPEDDPLHEVVKDGFRQFNYDPDRARGLLAEAGWTSGSDGTLRHSSDGRAYRTHIWSNEATMSAIASYWRTLGIQVEEQVLTPAQNNDREFRSGFPGWDTTGTDIMSMMGSAPATAENRWVGSRNGYDDARARSLVNSFETTIGEREQAQILRQIHDLYLADLPALPVYYNAIYIGHAKHVKAFDDLRGGGSFDPYGSHYRNAYLWDVQ
jgi:peptide/nickel transport system substrate-binding protein